MAGVKQIMNERGWFARSDEQHQACIPVEDMQISHHF